MMPSGGLLRCLALLRIEPAQLEFHLARVGRFEVTDLELDCDELAHATVEEQEIEVVIVAIQGDTLLALEKGEAGSELKKKALNLTEDR
jgi:hypothetical protein